MQEEVKQQLMEAAKRRALAKKHREQAQVLAAKAVEDRTAADVLKRKSAYAHAEAAVKSDAGAVKTAEQRIRMLKEKAATRDAAADKDEAKADQLKEDVLTMDDRAGTLTEQASEEEARVKVVRSAAEKEASGLPALLRKAVSTEARAAKLKRAAQARMADSTAKMARAGRLDALAAAKERQARVMRTRLVGILAAKTEALDRRREAAAASELAAKRGAATAAREAESLADEAEEKEAQARAASSAADQDGPVSAAASGDEEDEASTRERLEAESTPYHRQLMETRRRTNLLKSAMATVHIRGARGRVAAAAESAAAPAAAEEKGAAAAAAADGPARTEGLAEVPANGAAAAVEENEDGEMVVKGPLPGPTTASLAEDGHYSEREEAFKRALAAAYRGGYEHGPAGAGPNELLQQGAGDTVRLDSAAAAPAAAPAAAAEGGAPLFTQLWYDPESLPAVTRELQGTTRHLARLAPPRPAGAAAYAAPPDATQLYEDGHQSRSEQEFNREMGKYRQALQEQRAADLARARRAARELATLPGGAAADGPGGGEATTAELAQRRGDDFESERHRAYLSMLAEPQNQWDAAGPGALTKMQQAGLRGAVAGRRRREPALRVREDDDGRLVLDDGRNAALDEFDGGDEARGGGGARGARGGGEARETELALSSSRGSRVERLREELRLSLAREDRLERRTDRLEGEVEALRDDGPRRRARLEEDEDDSRRRGGGRRYDELRRRREEEGGRRGREDMLVEERPPRDDERRGPPPAEPAAHGPPPHGGAAAAARGGGGDGANFKPDATYEKEYARDPGHVSVGEIKFQHALKQFDQTKAMLRAGAQADSARFRLPQLIPAHLPGQGL